MFCFILFKKNLEKTPKRRRSVDEAFEFEGWLEKQWQQMRKEVAPQLQAEKILIDQHSSRISSKQRLREALVRRALTLALSDKLVDLSLLVDCLPSNSIRSIVLHSEALHSIPVAALQSALAELPALDTLTLNCVAVDRRPNTLSQLLQSSETLRVPSIVIEMVIGECDNAVELWPALAASKSVRVLHWHANTVAPLLQTLDTHCALRRLDLVNVIRERDVEHLCAVLGTQPLKSVRLSPIEAGFAPLLRTLAQLPLESLALFDLAYGAEEEAQFLRDSFRLAPTLSSLTLHSLDHCLLSSKVADKVDKVQQLTSLDCCNTRIGVDFLSSQRSLETLICRQTDWRTMRRAVDSSSKTLRALDVSEVANFSWSDVETMPFQRLETLLASNTARSNSAPLPLRREFLAQLKSLNLSHNRLCLSDVKTLADTLQTMVHTLHQLDVRGNLFLASELPTIRDLFENTVDELFLENNPELLWNVRINDGIQEM